MANSYAIQITLVCPYCGKTFQAETWLIVDSNERPDLADQVIDGSLHKVSCPTCGRIDHLEVPFLLYRLENESQLVFSVPDEKTTEQIQKLTWPLMSCLAHHLGKMWQEVWLDEIDILPRSTFREVITGMEKADQECWYQELMFQDEMHLFADQESRLLFNLVLEFIRKDSSKNKCQLLRDHPTLLIEPALSALAFLLSLSDYEDTPGDEKASKLYPDQFRQCLKMGTVQVMIKGVHDQDGLAAIPDEIRPLILQALILNEAMQETDQPSNQIADQLIYSLEQALSHPDLPVPAKIAVLDNLASAHWDRNNDWETIDYLTEVLRLVPEGHPNRVYYLNRLEKAILFAKSLLGEPFHQMELIQCYQELVQLTPESHPDRITYLNKLADTLWEVYDENQNVDRLSQAIECYQEMIRLTPEDHPDRIISYFQLGNVLGERYQESHDEDDLSLATECLQKALQLMPDEHSDRPVVLRNMATCFLFRYERWGNLEDLCVAIEFEKDALRLCQVGSKLHVTILSNLGIDLRNRYRSLGNSEDLSAALDCFDQLLGMIHEKTLRYIMLLNTLGTTRLERFLLQDTMVDLSTAIDCCQQALGLIREDGLDAPAVTLNKLATALLLRYQRLGEIDDLSQAIDCLRQAVQLAPEIQEGRDMYLSNLGLAYLTHFHQSKDRGDLTKAVNCFEEAVRLTPETDPNRLMYLINLGVAHAIRPQLHAEVDDGKGEG